MTGKDAAIKAIQELPDSATCEDIEERVRFLGGIDKGLADVKGDRVVPHEEVKESLKKWLERQLARRPSHPPSPAPAIPTANSLRRGAR